MLLIVLLNAFISVTVEVSTAGGHTPASWLGVPGGVMESERGGWVMGQADPRAQCPHIRHIISVPSLAFPVLRGNHKKSVGLAVLVCAALGTCERGQQKQSRPVALHSLRPGSWACAILSAM